MTVACSTAFAQYSQLRTILQCKESRATYDRTQVSIATVRDTRYEMRITRGGHRPVTVTYPVEVYSTRRVGSPTVYRNLNAGVTLTINYSSTPNRNGERGATLNTPQAGREALTCRRL